MRTVGVVGGGIMGAGIAYSVASQIDCKVVLREVSADAISAAKQRFDASVKRAEKKGTPTQLLDTWMSRMQYTTEIDAFSEADLVVEAVFENLELKRKIFSDLDRIVPAPKLLCTNTSGLSISMIGGATQYPERVIGTHFFNPVPAMKLVEIVTGLATNQETITATRSFCEQLGKETIFVKDFPGFVVTRVGQAMMAEAVRCLEQGVASAADIVRGMRLGYNYPMGPLELIDLIGVDTELRVMQSMFEEMGETFRPSPLIKSMVAAGHLGRKSGRGFYDYKRPD